jgi:hypothetical protein
MFVDETTEAHTNMAEPACKHVESLSIYNCKVDYIYLLAKHMYRQKSQAKDAGSFSKCNEVVLP